MHNHPEIIKARLKIAGYELQDIARESHTHAADISRMLHHGMRLPKAETVIARVLETTPAELWPERYPDQRAA